MSGSENERLKSVYAKRDQHKGVKYYSLFHPGQLYMIQRREQELLAAMARVDCLELADRLILEVGCGSGAVLRDMVKYGAAPEKCYGIDLLPDRIAAAHKLSPPTMQLTCGNAENLPYPDGYFDLVLSFTVFTSILDTGMKRRISSEMLRVLSDRGAILWFDYFVNNPWNPDVRGVRQKEIATLFPGCYLSLKRTILASPITRALAPHSWLACFLLEKLKFLNTHYLGTILKTD